MWGVGDNQSEKKTSYFLTLNTVDWVDVFIRPVYKQVIVHTLNHFIDSKGLTMYAWSLMTNHLHLLVQSRPGFEFSDIIQQFGTFTNQKILEALETEPESRKEWMLSRFQLFYGSTKDFSIWQNTGKRVLVDLEDPARLVEYFEFIHENSVRDRFVDIASDYPYSSARDYSGQKGLVKITKLPEIEQLLSVTDGFANLFATRHIRS